jgi:hypothetical protein
MRPFGCIDGYGRGFDLIFAVAGSGGGAWVAQ